ncbi:hypothetical protein MNBD_GAMMA16-807 [hydrothermal vent metagenome]|uniref:Uncharacterized protein n=1 Tax=hydrothermal vent metagenome TaxID=652676 RepID=A0A3B0ZBF6_9ZZZZ
MYMDFMNTPIGLLEIGASHCPTEGINPISSASGKNSPGKSNPFDGCCQRTKASTQITRPLLTSI